MCQPSHLELFALVAIVAFLFNLVGIVWTEIRASRRMVELVRRMPLSEVSIIAPPPDEELTRPA